MKMKKTTTKSTASKSVKLNMGPASNWNETPQMGALKNAVESGSDTRILDVLSDAHFKIHQHHLTQAVGVAIVNGAKDGAKKLLDMGANLNQVAPETGKIQDYSNYIEYDLPLNLALGKGHFEQVKWFCEKAYQKVFQKNSGRSPYVVLALSSKYNAASQKEAMLWLMKQGDEPTDKEAAVIALGGGLDTLNLWFDELDPLKVQKLARSVLAPLASSAKGGPLWRSSVLETLKRAITLADGKMEKGVGLAHPIDIGSENSWNNYNGGLGGLARTQKTINLAHKLGHEVGGWNRRLEDQDRLTWPRLSALMQQDEEVFHLLCSIPIQNKEFKDLQAWTRSVKHSLDHGAGWSASKSWGSVGYKVADYDIPKAGSDRTRIEEACEKLNVWLEQQDFDRISKEGMANGKERAKKTARALRREAKKALEEGKIENIEEMIPEVTAPAPRRNRL